MEKIHQHIGCGLAIKSDIELPGLIPVGDRTPAHTVTVNRAELPMALTSGVEKSGPNWQRTADDFLMRVPGVARFRIRNENVIEYHPEDGQEPEDLTAFLTGSILGILLHLRGSVVLHASALMVGGRAVLFCGRSGAGKSTIAAALGERGYAMISDDLCVLSKGDDGRLWVEADGRQHKLWQRSLAGLDLADRKEDEVRHQINKFYVPPRARHLERTPVGALYELSEQRAGEEFGIETLAAPDAALLVRRNAFRPRIMWQLGQKADYFRLAAQLASQGKIARFRRPLDFKRIGEGLDVLEEDWRGIAETD